MYIKIYIKNTKPFQQYFSFSVVREIPFLQNIPTPSYLVKQFLFYLLGLEFEYDDLEFCRLV